MARSYLIETFGCQMNVHDSEKVSGTLLARGYAQVESPEEAALVWDPPGGGCRSVLGAYPHAVGVEIDVCAIVGGHNMLPGVGVRHAARRG